MTCEGRELLPKKSATAIQSQLQTIKQNEMTIQNFGDEISKLFVDLTISQVDGKADSHKVLKPLNEKLAVKWFADGSTNHPHLLEVEHYLPE